MASLDVLVVRDDSPFCHGGTCKQISSFLVGSFPQAQISFHDFSSFDPLPSCSPDIVVFSIPYIEQHPERLKFLQRHYPTTSMLGLLCPAPGESVHIEPSLLKKLDDFLFCPFTSTDVSLRVYKILHGKWQARELAPPPVTPVAVKNGTLIGHAPPFLEAVNKVSLLAKCDATVLISGATGTGKELFARAIHYHSARGSNPFIPLNCGALPDHLFENEVFGHAKGAFTDAATEQSGLLKEAEGGTLFLDEVDSLSPSAQIKLLRFLQDREYRPLGSSKTQQADVRILAATNTHLLQLVQDGKIREDLYYRLNILSLHVPTLGDRVEDIPILAKHFLTRYSRSTSAPQQFTEDALQKLMQYHWPGNVRELEAIIQRTVTLTSASSIGPHDLDIPGVLPAHGIFKDTLQHAKKKSLEQFERTYLTKLLAQYQGNITHAAHAAGKERRSFQRLLRKYDLDRRSFQTSC